MALNGDVLGLMALANVDGLTVEQKKNREAVFKALMTAVVEHIQTAGIVNVAVTATATGVTSGGSAAPVTGTGVGTIT